MHLGPREAPEASPGESFGSRQRPSLVREARGTRLRQSEAQVTQQRRVEQAQVAQMEQARRDQSKKRLADTLARRKRTTRTTLCCPCQHLPPTVFRRFLA
ncbi:unnamed protein product [Effrenium voratum]|nr:unnamed protein product [Effrenium voratum]